MITLHSRDFRIVLTLTGARVVIERRRARLWVMAGQRVAAAVLAGIETKVLA